jgi:hypothetical protein
MRETMTDQTAEVVESTDAPEDDAEVIETEGELPEGEEPEEEDLEEELDGVKVVGKKAAIEKLKAEKLMQADYTRKTQELAEVRKDIEFQREAMEYRTRLEQEFLSDIAEVKSIEKQLQAYQNINWDALIDADPVQAMKLERQARQLQSEMEQAGSRLTQKQQRLIAQKEHESAVLLNKGREALAREIPGFDATLAAKLKEFGKSRGYSDKTLDSMIDPAQVVDLYKQYKAAEVKKATKPKEVQEKPVTSITARKAGPSKDPEKMSMDEWLKWRNATKRTR